MSANRIIGLAVFVAGLVLLGFAWHAADAPPEQAPETLTGSHTDQTMWYLVLGAAATIGGGTQSLFPDAASTQPDSRAASKCKVSVHQPGSPYQTTPLAPP